MLIWILPVAETELIRLTKELHLERKPTLDSSLFKDNLKWNLLNSDRSVNGNWKTWEFENRTVDQVVLK